MPTWDEITPYTERSTFAKHASVTNALLVVHGAAFACAAAMRVLGLADVTEALEFKAATAIDRLELWRFLTYPFAHTVDAGPLIAFVLLGWMFCGAGNELEKEWGSARMLAFFAGTALYGAVAHALVQKAGALPDLKAREFYGPVMAVLLVHAVRHSGRSILLLLLVPVRALTAFWAVFSLTLLYAVLTLDLGSSPVAVAAAAGAGWVYTRLDARLDRLFEALQARAARTQFLEEFEVRREVDGILEKIQRSGMESLTRRERRLLKRASRIFQSDSRRSHE
jgi:membrane associated rhomboid family serine protease